MKLAKIILAIVLVVSGAVLGAPADISSPAHPQSAALAAPTTSVEELSPSEARAMAMTLAGDVIDSLTAIRAMSQNPKPLIRAKDDDEGDDDASPSKIIGQIASAIRPVLKQFTNIVSAAVPEGPQRQLVKATSSAINSLLPLLLKYALAG
ncbi:hypothetical protein FBU59_000420 [Linderina macrospora]|uniref:Uncharacterized protein n=1 Tax=Linderina macrospora TaxID=4868 RepID=A0ACC1JH59_9FUNG|nr:hypothetical protein FBU59_000420 [Linderina macrospora]